MPCHAMRLFWVSDDDDDDDYPIDLLVLFARAMSCIIPGKGEGEGAPFRDFDFYGGNE